MDSKGFKGARRLERGMEEERASSTAHSSTMCLPGSSGASEGRACFTATNMLRFVTDLLFTRPVSDAFRSALSSPAPSRERFPRIATLSVPDRICAPVRGLIADLGCARVQFSQRSKGHHWLSAPHPGHVETAEAFQTPKGMERVLRSNYSQPKGRQSPFQ